jgi:hypothetical protein
MPKFIVVFVLSCAFVLHGQENAKQLKPGEFDSYNEAARDLSAANFTKAIADLDAWRDKYPASEYRDDRDALYVQAYAGASQPAKSLDSAARLLAADLQSVFPGPAGKPVIIRLLYTASLDVAHIRNPTPEELAAGEKAARELMAWDEPLPGVTPAKWAEAQADMKDKAAAALTWLATLPGIQAMAKQPPDCAEADAAWTKALTTYPDKAVFSYELGRALLCESKNAPAKLAQAIYEFERAAVVDPTLGGTKSDPKEIRSYADNTYIRLHGSDEGLEEIRQQVKQSPFPPAGFAIRSAAEIAEQNRQRFETDHPQLALWLKIKAELLSANGEQYFDNEFKGAAVPQLTGRLMEAKPECRPRELLVAIPLPDSQGPVVSEIRLKLNKPMAGKPEPGTDFRWEAVPSAFSKEPFLLTMDADIEKIDGLAAAPCAAAASGRKH